MQLSVDVDNGMPIYEQLVRQVKYAVAEGVVIPGQMIPSVRDVARQLAINPNTVQRAYQQLQAEEIIESLRGRGMAVCLGAKKQCQTDRQTLLGERLMAVIEEAVRSGLDSDRLREMFERGLSKAIRKNEASS
jgi:GntR family transcriptional regulator